MHVIEARNVNDALYLGIEHLSKVGIRRDSRNGPVKIAPTPVTTVYQRPLERVVLWPERDANPFFHLYESLWMLAGRRDVAPLARYAKQMLEYSDDGKTLHGAYGYRWRHYFNHDQLKLIAEALQKNPDDRRQVLQMWSAELDLGRTGKDVPCNVMATFQINTEGTLDLTVFCRSNDIIWGAYGANAVHFSFLLEYMALWVGVPVGRLYQVSVNWHAYLEVFEPLEAAFKDPMQPAAEYVYGGVKPMTFQNADPKNPTTIAHVDKGISILLDMADEEKVEEWHLPGAESHWVWVTHRLLYAHQLWRTKAAPERYELALEAISDLDPKIDFVIAAKDWIARRAAKWTQKMAVK